MRLFLAAALLIVTTAAANANCFDQAAYAQGDCIARIGYDWSTEDILAQQWYCTNTYNARMENCYARLDLCNSGRSEYCD